jgi:hypothetical protein
LTPLDFLHWGFVKGIVYCEKVQNVNELHERIIRTAECITNGMLNTWQEAEYHLDVWHATNGAHIGTYRAHKKLCEIQCLKIY